MQKKPLIKERLVEQLREQIRSMQQSDYIKIAPERELAESLGVSRISLRAAIKTLVDEGLLAQQQGRGTYIRPLLPFRALYLLCPPDMKRNDPYYSQFLLDLTNSAAKQAISLTMVDPERLEGDPHGVLIAMGQMEAQLLERISGQYGYLIVAQAGESPHASVRICYDDTRIGRDAAELLLVQGHRSIIHLAGPDKYPSASHRLRGFTERLSEAGISPVILREKMNWPGGYRSAEAVISLLAGCNPPSAVFAANDWMAIGLIQKLKEHGISIPGQVSVIGCDDIHLSSEFEPALSTFQLDMKDLVSQVLSAAETFESGQSVSKTVLLPARFISRDTLKTLT
ncbi:MAG: GntR family transcriptional regulator [Paenibacillaceae bacterium]|jgi:DNA-binding LacI/PurR family transcriptional regulator/biotin operon repressor|nr:GntR family transcriptional regulator [Paenibacillaceae bacterium]